MIPTAILIDGAFFLKRYSATYGSGHSPEKTAKNLFTMCLDHLEEKRDLHRILFYDCPPLEKKAHNPVTGRAVDFSKTEVFDFRIALHGELRRLRKVAFRLGRLGNRTASWRLTPSATKSLLAGDLDVKDLSEDDVVYEVRQKGVDMKMGLDIASLAYKRMVKRIVLIAGDADFVPAAKLARREGIDVVLDPMWQQVGNDLHEHIDGLTSKCPKPAGMRRVRVGSKK